MSVANLIYGLPRLKTGIRRLNLPFFEKLCFGFVCCPLPEVLCCDASKGSVGLLVSCSEQDVLFPCCVKDSPAVLCSLFAASGMF